MSAFWDNLSDRERLMIAACGAVMVAAAILFLIVNPVMGWRSAAAARAAAGERSYGLVVEAAKLAPPGPNARGRRLDLETPARNAVFQTSEPAGVPLAYVNALADGAVTITADGVNADRFYAWVDDLERRFGIVVITADVARDSRNPELIRVQATVGREG